MPRPIRFRDYEPSDLEAALAIALEAWPENEAVLPTSFIRAEIELYRALATWASTWSQKSETAKEALTQTVKYFF